MEYVGGIGVGAVLCAVRRIATLRVLTAYIPRTPGPKTATRARPRPGLLPVGPRHVAPRPNVSYNLCRNEGISENMFRICVAYVRHMYRISMTYAHNMYGISMEYVGNMYGICMEYVRYIYEIFIGYVWDVYAMCMEYVYSICGKHVHV